MQRLATISTVETKPLRVPHPGIALQAHLEAHIKHLREHWDDALARFQYDAVWLSAGEEQWYFQDDQGPAFKANPYLCQWVNPEYISPGSRLLIRRQQPPILFLYAPTDYWHAAPPLPDELQSLLDVRTFSDPGDLISACVTATTGLSHLAHIGPDGTQNEAMGDSNPVALLNHMHFHRARKSEYELTAMRMASLQGAAGHLAAAEAFTQGGTEFDIHLAYLQASQQTEAELPYGNIVALNEHASILHYQHQQRSRPRDTRSLLIDAGAQYRGYASDITRTYAADHPVNADFAGLIMLMEEHQQRLVKAIRPGMTFADLHVLMHQQLAGVLTESGLVRGDPETVFATGITEAFCPHGLGHLLGLQVHDVGGHLANARGDAAPPPPNYPSLRFTRTIETDQVFTIEPGLYFIPSLLAPLRAQNTPVNWSAVDALLPCGGIRIEDNIRALPDGVENLTRDAFASCLDA